MLKRIKKHEDKEHGGGGGGGGAGGAAGLNIFLTVDKLHFLIQKT